MRNSETIKINTSDVIYLMPMAWNYNSWCQEISAECLGFLYPQPLVKVFGSKYGGVPVMVFNKLAEPEGCHFNAVASVLAGGPDIFGDVILAVLRGSEIRQPDDASGMYFELCKFLMALR